MTDDDVRAWWRQQIAPESGPVRATRARLRRAHGWQEAMLEPAAIALAACLHTLDHEQRLRMALRLSTVLAHVKEDAPGQRLMGALGHAAADPPRLARQRFTRLLRSTPDELPMALIRLVRLAGGVANVGELGGAMMRWVHEGSREHQRRRWAFDYFNASAAAPHSDSDTAEPEGISA
jgi:CRISPR type I-E-associated protein CasB/Cse2